MERKQEMSNKHTPEPWSVDPKASLNVRAMNNEGILRVTANCGGYSSNVVDPLDENLANAQRIVECVNALSGIEDVEGFMKIVKEALENDYCLCQTEETFWKHVALSLFPTKEDK